MSPPQVRYASRSQRQGPISLPVKIFQGLGSIPNGIKDFAFRSFLLLYYNQVLGLPASQASIALLLALIVDAVSDPVVGAYSDALHHKLGRRHPLMLASTVPLGVSIYFLFAPVAASAGALFWWLLGFAVATRLSLTFFAVPWNALFAEMSDDYRERSELVSYRFIVVWVVGLVFTFSVYGLIFTASQEHPLGQLNPANYPTFALTVALVVAGGALLTTLLTLNQVPYLKHPVGDPVRFSFASLVGDLRLATGNREFTVLVLAVLANAVVSGTTQALEIYMNTYFWGFGGEQLRWMALSATGGLLAFVTVLPLQNLFDKKYLLIFCSVAISVVSMVPVSIKLLGWAPPAGSVGLLLMVVAAATCIVYLVTIVIIMFASMVADTLDLQELQTGMRQEGLFNSVMTFAGKATSGFGLLIAGVLLDYVVGMPEAAAPEQITQGMVTRLAVLDAYVVPLFNVAWLLLVLRYGITRQQHDEIRAQLDAR